MKKTQLRLLLDKEGIKVSNTRIGEVALSLGFGNTVDSTYTGQESTQLLAAIRQDYPIKARELKRPQHPNTQPGSVDLTSQLSQSQIQAQEAAETLKVALVTSHQRRLVDLIGALDKAEQP